MFRALHTASTGMAAQEQNVNSISNNIANTPTTAFKKERAEFEDLVYQNLHEAGEKVQEDKIRHIGLQVGSGARVAGIRKDFSQGAPQMTSNPFDLMINGQGFFGIQLPNGTQALTRDGSFGVNPEGKIVNRQGYSLEPEITVPSNTKSINISEDGTVDAYIDGQVEPVRLGKIPVFMVANSAGLKSMGQNLYTLSSSSGEAIQMVAGVQNAGIIMQGALEASNVNIMNEMTNLIKAQRAYEMNSKVMGVADQMLGQINNIK